VTVIGQDRVDPGTQQRPQPHQLHPVPQHRPQLPHRRRGDPRLRQQVGTQQLRQRRRVDPVVLQPRRRVVLVRGGDLDPDILSEDAVRYHSIYGVYGISVFAVRDATIDELAQQAPLVRFDRLSLLTVRDVLAAGMSLEPTGRNPRHFTVGFDDLETGVRRLVSCAHRVVPNAYHDA
jgi:hypothetical protein